MIRTKVKFEPLAGTSIYAASLLAQNIADTSGVLVEFNFNGVICTSYPGGDAETLAERQQEEQSRPKEANNDPKGGK